MGFDGEYIGQYMLENNTTISKLVEEHCNKDQVEMADSYADMFLKWICQTNKPYTVGEAHNVAIVFSNKGLTAKAIKYYRLALQFDPDFAHSIPPLIISLLVLNQEIDGAIEEAGALWTRLNEIYSHKFITTAQETGDAQVVVKEIHEFRAKMQNQLNVIRNFYQQMGVNILDYDLPMAGGWFR